MNELEQLMVIVNKEIKTKEWLLEHEDNIQMTRQYWAGGLATLMYIKHVIERLINNEDGQ